MVIAGGALWFLNANRPASVATKAPAEAARLSIVVLPFANLSGDPGQDYLVDALTDELTTGIARLRETFVIARNTAMTFKGKPVDAKAIGKDSGVRYVLEGSVQPSGDRMRVNAQLIDAGTGAHLWPTNSTRPAPICCRRRTRSSRVWRTQSAFSLQRPRAPVSNGRPRQIPTPRTWLFNATRAIEGRICRQGGGCGICALRPGARHRSQQCPRPEAMGVKFLYLAALGGSGDPKGDLERADKLDSKALALDPDLTWPHQ